MRAMKLTGIRQMELMKVPDPEIQDDHDVLIRMMSVGVCGSDVHYYTTGRIGTQIVQYPFMVGHEGAGIVEKVGPAVNTLKPGDHVAIDPAMPCFDCDQCKAGRYNTCRHLCFLGCPGQAEGCLCDFLVMPESSCFKIDNRLNFEQAAISEPLAIGVYAVKSSIPMKGAKVGILGCGPIGMSVLLPALEQGAQKVYVSDKIDARLNIALQSGASWIGNTTRIDVVKEIIKEEPLLLDVVFETCGQQDAVDQALDLLKPGGKLMLIGIPEVERISFVMDKMRRKEICVQNVRRQNGCVRETLDKIANGTYRVKDWVTHRFPLEQAQDAFELVANYHDGVLKAMIEFD